MANSYSQLYVHFVFATKYRTAALSTEWDERLRMYISGIVSNNGHKPIAINNMHDHLHLLVGLSPAQSVSALMQVVKGDSSEWINEHRLTPAKFHWQSGYGAFSHSRSQISAVARYIDRQQEHHKRISFREEYLDLLEKFEVTFDPRYVFTEPE
jgi:putative transposase